MARKKRSAKSIDKRIDEAVEVLKALELPRAQQNRRFALALLALLGLKPDEPWTEASAPLMGITPMMDFFQDQYHITYAPNTRETVRRFSVHQFLQAGLIVANPDSPSRPTNSPKAVYQISPEALGLLRHYGSPDWEDLLSNYLTTIESLKKIYARERLVNRLPVKIDGEEVLLSPGGHNELAKKIIDEFCPIFTPGGRVLYLGDTQKKWAHFDQSAFRDLGIAIDEHGKMPDVVVHYVEKNWLVLIEAVTSHGPVNPKRHRELKDLFKACSAGLVFVTAFLTRQAMLKYLGEISWETEVWVAESPTHMIHFNGERFLGPY